MVRVTMDRSVFYEGLPNLKPTETPLDRTNINPSELDALQSCMTELCIDLTIYKQLFTQEESIEALNRFNKLIFSRMQGAFMERICMQISCLLDPAKTGAFENLSLKRFKELTNDQIIIDNLDKIDEIYRCTGMQDWRRKILAHLDLKTAVGENKVSISVPYQEVENIVQSIQRIVDRLREPGSRMDIFVQLPNNLCGTAFIDRIKNL